tara:strand:+ start:341 stop:544 length:204 start_codon:yes stop_codon:yes gene_type:complete
MRYLAGIMVLGSLCFIATGCDGDVETTEDSTKIELEVPKVDLGNEPADLDPTTDDDVDIDTPLEGDK